MPANYLVRCKSCRRPLGFAYEDEPGVNDALCGAVECDRGYQRVEPASDAPSKGTVDGSR